jgi:predicted Zn-dependent protease with MMP-like domain
VQPSRHPALNAHLGHSVTIDPTQNDDTSWKGQETITRRVVDSLISQMPESLRLEALRIGYDVRQRAEEDSDKLGDYVRLGPLITLYVDSIREYCDEEGRDFEQELKSTYLHELGHHFGLNEEQLKARNL